MYTTIFTIILTVLLKALTTKYDVLAFVPLQQRFEVGIIVIYI